MLTAHWIVTLNVATGVRHSQAIRHALSTCSRSTNACRTRYWLTGASLNHHGRSVEGPRRAEGRRGRDVGGVGGVGGRGSVWGP